VTLTKRIRKNDNLPHSDIDLELWINLDHAHSALSRARELELAQYGITPEQAAILNILLSKGGSATNAEIADTVIRQYNSITTLVNRMAMLDLVSKEKSAEHRKFLVTITPKGKNVYENVTFKSIRMAFSEFSSADKQKILYYLSHMVDKSRNMLQMDNKLPFLS
jgi:DNA-binding MarR family transcriptional regulator